MNQHLIKEIQQLKHEVALLKEVERKTSWRQGIHTGADDPEAPSWGPKKDPLEERIEVLENMVKKHDRDIDRILKILGAAGDSPDEPMSGHKFMYDR